MNIQVLDAAYRGVVDGYVRYLWGGPVVVSCGEAYDTRDLLGFVAIDDGVLLGFVLYRPGGPAWEVATLLALVQGIGAGTQLLDTVVDLARQQNAHRVWLITTNDNTHAIRFYQKYGFALKAVHIDAFEETRRIKAEAPENGMDGIPIQHEFEFELTL